MKVFLILSAFCVVIGIAIGTLAWKLESRAVSQGSPAETIDEHALVIAELDEMRRDHKIAIEENKFITVQTGHSRARLQKLQDQHRNQKARYQQVEAELNELTKTLSHACHFGNVSWQNERLKNALKETEPPQD